MLSDQAGYTMTIDQFFKWNSYLIYREIIAAAILITKGALRDIR